MTLSSSLDEPDISDQQADLLNDVFQPSKLSRSSLFDDPFSGSLEVTSQPRSSSRIGNSEGRVDSSLANDEPILIMPTEPDTIVVNPQPLPDGGFPGPIVGSQSRDRLVGTAEADVIRAQGGNDRLLGLAGDDQLVCGRGHDRAVGAAGDDWIKGASGDDKLKGGSGNDQLLGQNGDDFLIGGRGNDVLAGGKGENKLAGKQGQDIFSLHRRGTSVIQDYQDGRDRLELPNAARFQDLEITQVGRSSEIVWGNYTLAILRTVAVTELSNADFV